MATVVTRNKKAVVVYRYINEEGQKKQKWDSYSTKGEANKRKKFVDYYQSIHGLVIVPEEQILSQALMESNPKTEDSSITLSEFMEVYVEIYGQARWSVTSFRNRTALIKNYIDPMIGQFRLSEISARSLSKFYRDLLDTPEVSGKRPTNGKLVQPANVKKIHDLIRSALTQAIAWEYLPINSTNPAKLATLPKIPDYERKVWDIDTFKLAMERSQDDLLKLSMHLAFAGSLRVGEVLGLTWDCLILDEQAIENGTCRMIVEKQLTRVSKEIITQLHKKDIIKIFPSKPTTTSCLVLMTPKTDSSRRTVWLPKTVALMLIEHKKQQEAMKLFFGREYEDNNLVIALENGHPVENKVIGKRLKKLCKVLDLPKVEFHSFRHLSTTYKLKMTNGDIKSVQGDTGHSKADMVTEVYSHIIDEDRRFNASKLDQSFYEATTNDEELKEQEEQQKLLKILQSMPKEIREQLLSYDE